MDKRGTSTHSRKPKDAMDCLCPKCGRTHILKIDNWKGRGVPRKYCWVCKDKVKEISTCLYTC